MVRSTVADSILGGLQLAAGSRLEDESLSLKNELGKKRLRQADQDYAAGELDLSNKRVENTTNLINLAYLPDKLETERQQGVATLADTRATTRQTELGNAKSSDELIQARRASSQTDLVNGLGEGGFLNGRSANVLDVAKGRMDLVVAALNQSLPFLSTLRADGSETGATIVGLERIEPKEGKPGGWLPILAGGEKGAAPGTVNGTSDKNDIIQVFTDEQLQGHFSAGLSTALSGEGRKSPYLRANAQLDALNKSGRYDEENANVNAADQVLKPAIANSPLPIGAQRALNADINIMIANRDFDSLKTLADRIGASDEFSAMVSQYRADFDANEADRVEEETYYTSKPEFKSETRKLSEAEKSEIRRGRYNPQTGTYMAPSAEAAEAKIAELEKPTTPTSSIANTIDTAIGVISRVYPSQMRKIAPELAVQAAIEGKRKVSPEARTYTPSQSDIDSLGKFLKTPEARKIAASPEVAANVREFANNGSFDSQSLITLGKQKGEKAVLETLIAASVGFDKPEEASKFIQEGLNLTQRGQVDLSAKDAQGMKVEAATEERAQRQLNFDVARETNSMILDTIDREEGAITQVSDLIGTIKEGLVDEDFAIWDETNPVTSRTFEAAKRLGRFASMNNNGQLKQQASTALTEVTAAFMLQKAKQNTSWYESFWSDFTRANKQPSLTQLANLIVKNSDNTIAFRNPSSSAPYEGNITQSELKQLVGEAAAIQIIGNAPEVEF